MKIKVKRLTESATLPTRGTKYAAGLDLYADETKMIFPREIKLVKTGIAMAIPNGYFGNVTGRSGNVMKRGLVVVEGTIDADYRGNIGVFVKNDTGKNLLVQQGERIGQLVILPVPEIDLIETNELNQTERGEKGFGSTGR